MSNLGLCGFLPWVVYGVFVISMADSQTNNSAHIRIKTRAFDPEQSDNIVLDPRSWRPRAAASHAAFVATFGSVATAAVAFSFTYGDLLRFFFKSRARQPLSHGSVTAQTWAPKTNFLVAETPTAYDDDEYCRAREFLPRFQKPHPWRTVCSRI